MRVWLPNHPIYLFLQPGMNREKKIRISDVYLFKISDMTYLYYVFAKIIIEIFFSKIITYLIFFFVGFFSFLGFIRHYWELFGNTVILPVRFVFAVAVFSSNQHQINYCIFSVARRKDISDFSCFFNMSLRRTDDVSFFCFIYIFNLNWVNPKIITQYEERFFSSTQKVYFMVTTNLRMYKIVINWNWKLKFEGDCIYMVQTYTIT